jgi:hypothetical protein
VPPSFASRSRKLGNSFRSAGVAVLDVSGVADLRHLAVRDDVDPRLLLPPHVFTDRVGHAGVESGGVIILAPFAGKEEIHHLLRAGEGADMGGEKGHGDLWVHESG